LSSKLGPEKNQLNNWTLISIILYVGFVSVAYKSHNTELKQRNFHRTFTLKYFKASLKKKHLSIKVFCTISISFRFNFETDFYVRYSCLFSLTIYYFPFVRSIYFIYILYSRCIHPMNYSIFHLHTNFVIPIIVYFLQEILRQNKTIVLTIWPYFSYRLLWTFHKRYFAYYPCNLLVWRNSIDVINIHFFNYDIKRDSVTRSVIDKNVLIYIYIYILSVEINNNTWQHEQLFTASTKWLLDIDYISYILFIYIFCHI